MHVRTGLFWAMTNLTAMILTSVSTHRVSVDSVTTQLDPSNATVSRVGMSCPKTEFNVSISMNALIMDRIRVAITA